MKQEDITVRTARPSEFAAIGQLLFDVYSHLDGFPKPDEQTGYYRSLINVGEFTEQPGVELLVAVTPDDMILGAVVYFSDLQY